MKLTVFAATGGIGRQLLDQALAAGHDVLATLDRPETITQTVGIANGRRHRSTR
jgi:uncharacterized protein YbjT (DUF2867 family)